MTSRGLRGSPLRLCTACAGEFALRVSVRVGGSVVGLPCAQVCVMRVDVRCLQCGSRKWQRGSFAEWQQCDIL